MTYYTWNACENTDGWSAGAPATPPTTSADVYSGSYSIALGKTGSSSTLAQYTFSGAVTSSVTTSTTFGIRFKVFDTTNFDYVAVRIGSDASNYFDSYRISQSSINTGTWQTISGSCDDPYYSAGTIDWGAIDYARFMVRVSSAANTWTQGNVLIDELYYATTDGASGWSHKILGISPSKVSGVAKASIAKINSI